MKLLMFGHYSHTGFGRVTVELAERMVARGVDVRVIAVNYRGEPVKGPLGDRIWPAAIYGDQFGGNISADAINGKFWLSLDATDEWRPDAVLIVSDMGGAQGHIARLTKEWESLPVLHYCPIEGGNLMPSWRDIWKVLTPVAMSEYGARIIAQHTGRFDVPVIYHGVDTDTFRPVSRDEPMVFDNVTIRSKDDAKRAFGFDPARKLVLRADRLVPRKFYETALRTMADVMEQVPDVDFLIHCRPQDEGLNLIEEIARMPAHLVADRRFRLTNAHNTWVGLPEPALVALINAADVYFSPSAEGFGLNIAEALACEVPVVGLGDTSVPEVIGPGGVAVPPLHDSHGDPVVMHSVHGMDWPVPDRKAFVKPLVDLLSKPHRRASLGEAGRRHVLRTFNWNTATDQFIALLEKAIESRTPAEVAA